MIIAELNIVLICECNHCTAAVRRTFLFREGVRAATRETIAYALGNGWRSINPNGRVLICPGCAETKLMKESV